MLKCFYCIQYSQNLPLVVRGSTSIQIAFKIKENEIMTTKLIEFSKRVLLYSFSRGYAWASPCFIFHPFFPLPLPIFNFDLILPTLKNSMTSPVSSLMAHWELPISPVRSSVQRWARLVNL